MISLYGCHQMPLGAVESFLREIIVLQTTRYGLADPIAYVFNKYKNLYEICMDMQADGFSLTWMNDDLCHIPLQLYKVCVKQVKKGLVG